MSFKVISVSMLLLAGCNSPAPQDLTPYQPVDTTLSFKIDDLWATPERSFAYNSVAVSGAGQLHLVTCSDFVYFPFGKLNDRSSLADSPLKQFVVTRFNRDTFTNHHVSPSFFQWNESLELTCSSNKLSLFFDNDPEASTHGYIRSGKISDNNVVFANGIKIGMSQEHFYKTFFDYFPPELLHKYSVVRLESCVADITHIYAFNGGTLSSVEFVPYKEDP